MTESPHSPPVGNWTTVELSGHACDLFEPPRPSEHGFVVLYLHDINEAAPAEHPQLTTELSRHGLRLIAPQASPTWWTNRICSLFDARVSAEQYVIRSVLPYLAERWQAGPPRIALLGRGMGGQGALRLAFKYAAKLPIMAAISPAIDYQLAWREGDAALQEMYADPESARQETATLHIHPLNWPRNIWFCSDPEDVQWHDSADRLRMKLSALGIPHEADLATSAGGDAAAYLQRMVPRAIAFLADRLDREERRVV